MKVSLNSILLLSLLLPAKLSIAQFYEVSLDEKVANSTLILEGKVIEKSSFWNPAHTMIFTSNKVEVYKIFKGDITTSFIEVLTQGGSVGGHYVEASDLLTLEKGYIGTFFCYPNDVALKSSVSNNLLYDVYSSNQGFYKYNLSSNKAIAPFAEYTDITGTFYKILTQKTGKSIKVINASFEATPPKKKDAAARGNATATITSFSPATVNAGALNDPANNVLTVNGTGFGTPAAGKQLVFNDANNTSVATDYVVESTSPYITSWTDNRIIVKVPQRAATGNFGVVTAATDTGFAPANLQVLYAVINASFALSSGTIVSEPRLMNANTTGGYTIVYSTSTVGSGTNFTTDSAYDSFRRALQTWKDLTGVNFSEGGNTTSQVVNAGDNINTIMFDNTNTGTTRIPSGTLAITYNSYTICGGALFSQKEGFDIVVRKEGVSTAPATPPFNKSYCALAPNTNDFESTVLHELGHALNLGHINDPQEQTSNYTNRNPAKLMHPSITLSIGRKALDQSSYAGGLYTVTPQNNVGYGSCLYPGETTPTAVIVSPYNECPSTFPTLPLTSGVSVPIDLYHTTSNKYKDPQFTAIRTAGSATGEGVPVTNNAYYALKSDAGGNLTFSITDYTTFPAEAQANCPTNEVGVIMAIYQVNSCPAGQAYPAPAYVTTFNGNITRTINGFSANTTYLLYFDGLYGTKPAFNITFTGGTVLPILLSNFYGEANRALNNLFVELQSVSGNMKMIVEKSADGIAFRELGPITLQQQNTSAKYKYSDPAPFNGNNYYRLRTVNADGSFEYSKVILLNNNLRGKVLMYPNPVKGQLTINLTHLLQERYSITITDVAGRRVYNQQTGATVVTVPFSNKAKGSYFVQVTDSRNNVIAINKVMAGN